VPRFGGFAPILVFGLLLACQGDQNLPSDPGRGLDLTAGVCKSEDFTSYTEAMYSSASLERARLQQCKTALAALDKGNLVKAEAAVDAILVAIYQDYLNEDLSIFPGDAVVEESVIDYMAIACTLGGFTPPDEECLIPSASSDLENGSWVAVGPLDTGGTGELPNDLFGFRVDGGKGVYVFVSSRPVTAQFLGDCPGTSANDCQEDVFEIDADGTFTGGITVESCEIFDTGRLQHMHCPKNEPCQFGDPSPAPGLISCAVSPTGLTGLINTITKPVQWVIHATPAYAAGLGTKFTSFSPVVIGDMDPRARGVLCTFTSQYDNGSAGTICELFEDEAATTPAQCSPFTDDGSGVPSGVPCSCTSEASSGSSSESSCQMNPKVPELVAGAEAQEVTYTVKARKTGGSGGAYNAMSSVTLAADNPERGLANEVCFSMEPPSAFPVDCTTGAPLP
jgi:hypothetical protein